MVGRGGWRRRRSPSWPLPLLPALYHHRRPHSTSPVSHCRRRSASLSPSWRYVLHLGLDSPPPPFSIPGSIRPHLPALRLYFGRSTVDPSTLIGDSGSNALSGHKARGWTGGEASRLLLGRENERAAGEEVGGSGNAGGEGRQRRERKGTRGGGENERGEEQHRRIK